MTRAMVLFVTFGLMALSSFAQSPDLSGIEIKPTTDSGPAVDVDLGYKPADPSDHMALLPSEWTRFAGGFWTGIVGQGVFGTIPRVSSDEAFVDASERGLGIGVQLDFGVKHSDSQAIRFRLGYLALNVTPNDKTIEAYAKNELEAKLKLLHMQAMYRWSWIGIPGSGVGWVGAAVSANYVTETDPADLGVAPKSKLINTLGVGYQLALGWDFPVLKFTDLGVELSYHPFRSVSALLSLRTSL